MRDIKDAVIETEEIVETHTIVDTCRACGGRSLIPYLNLGYIPLVNRYLRKEDLSKSELSFPLQINYCKECSMSQLSIVVNPHILFDEYYYRSSMSRTFQQHCRKLAEDTKKRFALTNNSLVVEVASNDGILLRELKATGVKFVGVEPAKNLAKIANSEGLTTHNAFWNNQTASDVKSIYGSADVVVMQNVFAHIHDLDSALSGVDDVLKDDGVLIIEVPYMISFINKTEFDTAYHEHLSYFLIRPLTFLFTRHNMTLFDVEEFDMHGGSVRVYVKKTRSNKNKVETEKIKKSLDLEEELGMYQIETYLRFSNHIAQIKSELQLFLRGLKSRGQKIAAFGASAKGNVLLNYCEIGKETIDYIIDETPEKQGKYYPGNHIPIISPEVLRSSRPDYLVILPWNFVDEIISKTRHFKEAGGRYIIPIPALRII